MYLKVANSLIYQLHEAQERESQDITSENFSVYNQQNKFKMLWNKRRQKNIYVG